jgi:hypothetical protein
MGEKDINALIPEEFFRDLFDGQDDGTGGKVFGDDDSLPPEVLVGKDPDWGRLDADLYRKLPHQLSGMDGDQGDSSLPGVFVLAADA